MYREGGEENELMEELETSPAGRDLSCEMRRAHPAAGYTS